MKKRTPGVIDLRLALAFLAVLGALSITLGAQDRLKTMPGYEQFQKMSPQIQAGVVTSGALNATWKDDAKSFEYTKDRKIYSFDVATRQTAVIGDAPEPQPGGGRGGRGQMPPAAGQGMPPGRGQGQQAQGQAPPGRGQGQQVQGQTPPARGQGTAPERGRQFSEATSPDGKLKAFYNRDDQNLYLSDADGANRIAITTDGSRENRIKNGTASWVYGEELSQTTAMWWSADSRKIAYYRFDEKQVPDYHLQVDQTKLYTRDDVEAYPKPGQPNPIVELFVYDVAAKKSVKVDVRDGKPFENNVVGHYVYHVLWSPDGKELLFNRTNRRQNILELAAANPDTGAVRAIIRDEWLSGWVENIPTMIFLKDGKRFVWESERTGWKNFYLYDLTGKLLNPITSYTTFEAASLVKLDEERGVVFVTARDGENYLKMQLHRVGLDGKGDTRLTDPAFNHSVGNCMPRTGGRAAMMGGGPGGGGCGISPDNKYFVDAYQTHDTAPATRLVDASNGKVVTELAASDLTKFQELGFRKAELFTYKAADGKTTLHGLITFPSYFDPTKKYPALVSVYGGPAAANNTARESFVPPSATAEYGFLILNLDSRAVPGLGKRVLDSIYLKLGQTEMDDMAEGVKALWTRPYFDKDRVGIYGTSYGGYSAVMCVLRHPEAFRAGSASSPPTSWVHYDSIYTERYMWIPEENKDGYELGSAMHYADKLDGRLLIYYGTADNNVHPTNAMQLIQALQRAQKSFEVQVGPDAGHSGVNPQRMMEFFIENLVINKPAPGVRITTN
jgi:dipeptidyl-peptidase-4